MGSDSSKAIFAFMKIAVALVAGYGIAYFWASVRADADDIMFPGMGMFVPYVAGIIAAVMIFFLLTKLNKGGGD